MKITFPFLAQITNVSFPSGGFNHSYGFETLIESGDIVDGAQFTALLYQWLKYSVAPGDGTAVAECMRCIGDDDWVRLKRLGAILSANKVASEIDDASKKTGLSSLRVMREVFDGKAIRKLDALARRREIFAHQAIVFGACCSDFGIEPQASVEAFLHATLHNIVCTAVRLIPLGQIEAQRIIAGAWRVIDDAVDIALARDMDTLGGLHSRLDIAAMQHEHIHTRLCMS